MEGFLRDEENAPGGVIPAQECVGALYQMIHALDLAQRRFALRHYDIKLLNFFLKKVDLEGKEDALLSTRPMTTWLKLRAMRRS